MVELAIKRPTFITCVVLVMLAVGTYAISKLGVDLFPNVTFPVVTVTTAYPGAGPSEIETLVSKPLEDEMSTISGVKRLSSTNQEGVSTVVAEFTLETDVKYAEQQVRDRVSSAKVKFPKDAKESIIRRIDPGDQPVLQLSLDADLEPQLLYDLANEFIRPRLEQVNQVGLVEVLGGRKREIIVDLDRKKLKSHEISASQIAQRLAVAGENVPIGKVAEGHREMVFRSLGEFKNVDDIKKTIINFFGSDVPVTLAQVGNVRDGLEDENSRAFVNGNKSLFIYAYRQSGANTISVVDRLIKRVDQLNKEIETMPGHGKIRVIRDGSVWIRINVEDVKESILIGVVLAVFVVFLFLANGRSTIITGLALPNSLIGAFVLMWAAGFTINVMTLLALSLSVGLLIDDAIVVRENIFRYIELGKNGFEAARLGTKEVLLAVIATTFTVLGVFGPVGFLKGVTGQFFKEFGLTICFAMIISLFDALTVAPMLSAYFAGKSHESQSTSNSPFLWPYRFVISSIVQPFARFQDWLEAKYEATLRFTLRRPGLVLTGSFLIFLASCSAVKYVPKTFLPPQDAGEFACSIDLPPGASLDETAKVAAKVDSLIRSNHEVKIVSYTVGNRDGQPNVANFYVALVPRRERKLNTSGVKEVIREQLKTLAYANPVVGDYDAIGGGLRPFTMNITGDDPRVLEAFSAKVLARLKQLPGLKDVDTNYRPGKPEFQVSVDNQKADALGVSTVQVGNELRAQIEGVTPAKFRVNGREYDVRLRLQDDQRNLREAFDETYVPNINYNLVHLKDVALGVEAEGPAKITRQDRGRYIQFNGDITPGAGLGDIMQEVGKILKDELKMPESLRYTFIGQAENFQELGESVMTAMGFGILFIFLILASLYESFVTPLTIMLALPLALCGSFVFLFLFKESLNIFSMIGCIMLLGVATKNSILLVDYANHLVGEGKSRADAMITAGKTRLRPILMTTMALIAGTIPVAVGLNEASKQRTSMGIAIIGGLISSTLLTLVVVPAAYSYIDRFRMWSKSTLGRIFGAHSGTSLE